MIVGTTPADPADRGQADPALTAALADGSVPQIRVALLRARLLVPVVASPVDGGDAEMAVPLLVSGDGRRALPVFSSYDALRAWRDDARPVPMAGARVFAAAVAEGHHGVVLDVAGLSAHTVAGADLRAMAEAAEALLSNPDAQISAVE
jgi:hypothetical protein